MGREYSKSEEMMGVAEQDDHLDFSAVDGSTQSSGLLLFTLYHWTL